MQTAHDMTFQSFLDMMQQRGEDCNLMVLDDEAFDEVVPVPVVRYHLPSPASTLSVGGSERACPLRDCALSRVLTTAVWVLQGIRRELPDRHPGPHDRAAHHGPGAQQQHQLQPQDLRRLTKLLRLRILCHGRHLF